MLRKVEWVRGVRVESDKIESNVVGKAHVHQSRVANGGEVHVNVQEMVALVGEEYSFRGLNFPLLTLDPSKRNGWPDLPYPILNSCRIGSHSWHHSSYKPRLSLDCLNLNSALIAAEANLEAAGCSLPPV